MSASILWETSYIIGFRLIWLSRSAGVNRIRFMSSPDRLAIVGVGHTEFGVIPEKSGTMLAVEAMRAAIADAGLRRSDIGGVVCQPGHGYGAAGEAVLRLGLPVNFYMDMQVGGATAILSIMCAAGAIAQGDADYVVSIYSTKARSAKVLVGGSQEETGSESVWGMFSPGARNAMRARHYLSKYDLGPETFWPVVSNQRGHANKRPDAMMHDRLIALEDYRDSPWVAEPFRRFDYCMMNDGAAAFVITTESRAADLPKKPVLVLGSGVARPEAERTMTPILTPSSTTHARRRLAKPVSTAPASTWRSSTTRSAFTRSCRSKPTAGAGREKVVPSTVTGTAHSAARCL